jgi:hypothetical protein
VQVAQVDLVLLALVVLVAQVAQVVQLVLVVQVALVAPVALRVPDSARLVQVLVAGLLPVVALVHHAQVALLVVALVVAVAVSAAEPQVPSERVVLADHLRLANQSVQSAKSTSKDKLLALVAQLCHVATATPFFVCVAAQAFKTSQTRSMPTLAS